MKAPGSPRWRKAGRPANMPSTNENIGPYTKAAQILDELGDPSISPEELVKAAAPAAIRAIVQIMRKPGRNAAAQLRAAETLMRYGVQEPAKATTVSAPDGGAVQVQSRHEIVFVKPGEIPEGLR